MINVLLISVLLLWGGDISRLKKADELYRQGKFDQALEIYQSELNKNPGDYATAFNVGNALFKSGKFDEAEKAWAHAKSLTQKPGNVSASAYNQAVADFQKRDLQEALKQTKEAIRMNPDDEDARANFEVLSRLLKKQQEQQKNNQKKDQKKDQDQKKDDKKEDKKQQDQKNQEQNQKKQQQVSQIPKEQAQRLLDALKKNEKEALLKKKEMQSRSRKQVDKDW